MEKINSFFHWFFKKESYYQKKLREINKLKGNKINKISNVLMGITFLLSLSFIYTKSKIVMYLSLFFSVVYILVSFLSTSIETLTTIKGFLSNGILITVFFSLVLFLILKYLIRKFGVNISNDWIFHVGYLILTITLSLVWFVLSTFSNAKVATIANAIISVIIAIIIQFNSFYWNIFKLENKNFLHPSYLKILEYSGIDQYDIISTSIDLILFPLFVMVTVGALGAAVKEYWNTKHNSNNDI